MRTPRPLRDESGLVEVLAVVGLFSLLVAVALPSYIGFQDRKAVKAAQVRLQAAVPAAQAYREDRGSYAGLDSVDLFRIDPRISQTLAVAWIRHGRYCLTDTVRGRTWSVAGPAKGKLVYRPNADCS